MQTQINITLSLSSAEEFKSVIETLRGMPNVQSNVAVSSLDNGRGPWERRWIESHKAENVKKMTRSQEEIRSGKDRETIARERCEREGIALDEPAGEYAAPEEKGETVSVHNFSAEDVDD